MTSIVFVDQRVKPLAVESHRVELQNYGVHIRIEGGGNAVLIYPWHAIASVVHEP